MTETAKILIDGTVFIVKASVVITVAVLVVGLLFGG